jgi:hypothetical protein
MRVLGLLRQSQAVLERDPGAGQVTTLAIQVTHFTGRHRYELNYGSDADPHLSFTGPDGEFSSLNRPRRSFAGPGFVTLGSRGAVQVGFGYIANRSLSASVAAVGTVHCPVPRRGHGH